MEQAVSELQDALPQPKTLQPGGAADAPSREDVLADISLVDDKDPGGPNLQRPDPGMQKNTEGKS